MSDYVRHSGHLHNTQQTEEKNIHLFGKSKAQNPRPRPKTTETLLTESSTGD
jgi:hypothetical protein